MYPEAYGNISSNLIFSAAWMNNYLKYVFICRLQGEPVNLREQQDAVEFFMSLVESLDEALKALSQDQIMSKTLGGSYSDQKICQGCPHRYVIKLLLALNLKFNYFSFQVFQRRTI